MKAYFTWYTTAANEELIVFDIHDTPKVFLYPGFTSETRWVAYMSSSTLS